MNTTRAETASLIQALLKNTGTVRKTTIMIAPPFTNLQAASELLLDSHILLGAQNVHWEDKGAFTGEISPLMLVDLKCTFVIIGHSERRQYFGETDQTVNRRINAALRHNLLPIICVGETLEQRENKSTLAVVETQIRNGLAGFSSEQAAKFTIAYEPVWAIGTGRAASPQDAVEVHTMIRSVLAEIFGSPIAEQIRIQYGGSATRENVAAFMSEPQIDGALVGGASLIPESFTKIIELAEAQD